MTKMVSAWIVLQTVIGLLKENAYKKWKIVCLWIVRSNVLDVKKILN